jgi:hypothetical protein
MSVWRMLILVLVLSEISYTIGATKIKENGEINEIVQGLPFHLICVLID